MSINKKENEYHYWAGVKGTEFGVYGKFTSMDYCISPGEIEEGAFKISSNSVKRVEEERRKKGIVSDNPSEFLLYDSKYQLIAVYMIDQV